MSMSPTKPNIASLGGSGDGEGVEGGTTVLEGEDDGAIDGDGSRVSDVGTSVISK
ncbi:MAG TPA: hypothetical protein VN608_09110 [Clostridia bacterium]|nr:hypothetical protein [Clostridia bacterium]